MEKMMGEDGENDGELIGKRMGMGMALAIY